MAACEISQSSVIHQSIKRFKKLSAALDEELQQVGGPRKPEVRLLNEQSIFLEKFIFKKNQLLFFQVLLSHQQHKICQLCPSKLRCRCLGMHQDRGGISSDRKNSAGVLRPPEKTEHFGTGALSGTLKDIIHTSGVTSTSMSVENCLPTVAL